MTVSPDKRRHGNAKLTEAQREEIRRRCLAGEFQADLAREFRVTQPTISIVVNPDAEQRRREYVKAWTNARYGVDLEWTERRRETVRRCNQRRRDACSQQAAE